MATLNLFGLTYDSVRAHHFPNSDAWVTGSRPSSTTVTETLTEVAGRMAGALNLQNIDASQITLNTSPAYVSCRRIVRLATAYIVARDMLGADPAITQAWKKEVDDWFTALGTPGSGGEVFLGGGATSSGSSDPDGPTSHLSVFGLTGDSASNMSSTIPPLRKDDQL